MAITMCYTTIIKDLMEDGVLILTEYHNFLLVYCLIQIGLHIFSSLGAHQYRFLEILQIRPMEVCYNLV